MLKIENNDIYLTRGDTASIEISLVDENGNEYVLDDEDRLVFTLKNSEHHKDELISKMITVGVLHIEHEDTKDLTFGKYKYDVQLSTKNGEVFTVIEPSLFVLLEEVNWND